MDKILTTTQVANRLNLHPETVRKLIREGLLKAFKYGGNGNTKKHWHINESIVLDFIKGNQND